MFMEGVTQTDKMISGPSQLWCRISSLFFSFQTYPISHNCIYIINVKMDIHGYKG